MIETERIRCKICGELFIELEDAEKHIPSHFGFFHNLIVLLKGNAKNKLNENLEQFGIRDFTRSGLNDR